MFFILRVMLRDGSFLRLRFLIVGGRNRREMNNGSSALGIRRDTLWALSTFYTANIISSVMGSTQM